VSWSKFDFVPGDKVIFSDGPDIMEENGEFPSRWDTDSGQSEIASVDGENVILFIDGNPKIMPYLKNANEDYLPDVFTIEFDLYRAAGSNRFFCQLYDTKNQRANNNEEITIGYNYISCGDFKAEYPGMNYTWQDKSRWMHISIAYTKGKLKMYMDDVRLINIPRYAANPTGFTLNAYFANRGEGLGYFVKNVRIAKGGVKYYDRVMQDGKIICNGIRFDVNKATLKPESMGPINKICELMQKKPEIKFSVEGHTDSDGDDNKNQQLSEQRAQAVMQQMVAMGISADRLSSKGFGESQPIDNNATPEGKANNRRVEFVVQ
jgi:outer membrane protein OmpA-like peptidoglycan-associated protein